MSAGICIMNRNAIAMAADSAVTIGDHVAIHNSANKLFSLSTFAPIGAIIYANADFMSVPMETILKEFKKHIGHSTFPQLQGYLKSFVEFLESNIKLFRFEINEKEFVQSLFIEFVQGLLGDYAFTCQNKELQLGRELLTEERMECAQCTINETIKYVDGQEWIPNSNHRTYIKDTYYTDFCNFLSNHEDFAWLSEEQALLICEKACDLFDTTFDRNGYVGLAIAGYGEEDIFPKLIHIHLSGVINGKVRYSILQEAEINEQARAFVVPLAQVDVMQTFLFGINDSFLGDLAREIPQQISESFSRMDDSLFVQGKKEEVCKQLTGLTGNILNHIHALAFNNYMNPIFDSVSTLPVEELGLLAESMINITSIRRKVALDSYIGTVGGPIDVAIISKGDGFIWLKRKHYFDRKYNPQFFHSHYRTIEE